MVLTVICSSSSFYVIYVDLQRKLAVVFRHNHKRFQTTSKLTYFSEKTRMVYHK